jgi:hypothetical protein
VQSIPTNNRTDRNNTAIVRPKQNDRRQREVAKIMFQTAPEHFHHVWRTGDVNPKIVRVQLMHDLLKLADRRFRVPPFHENDHVAGLPVGRDQQPAPERTLYRVFKTLRSLSQALYRARPADRMNALGEFLNSTQVSRRRNISRRHCQNYFRLGGKLMLNLFGLLDAGIAG